MELEALMEESIKKMEGDFYNKKFYFSYSSLNKILWSPAAFHQMYVLGIKEERQESHLVQGKIIHALLLEPEKFDKMFIVSPDTLPTGNLRTVIDRVFAHHNELAKNGDQREKLEEFAEAIIDIMKDMNYHQSLKTDQQRIDKIMTPEAFNYWSFLKMKGDKTLIDRESYDFCKNAVEIIKTNKKVCNLLGCDVTDFDNKQVFNEFPIQIDIPNRIFGLKGIIDNIVLDHDKKIIYINDVKTTSKDLKDFPETVEFYSYWIQAIIYTTLITQHYLHFVEQGYEVKFHFVVVDRMFQAYAYPVKEQTLISWIEKLNHCLDKAEWHYIRRSYDLPYEFANNMATL